MRLVISCRDAELVKDIIRKTGIAAHRSQKPNRAEEVGEYEITLAPATFNREDTHSSFRHVGRRIDAEDRLIVCCLGTE